MISINHYSGTWQTTLRPLRKAPRAGSLVLIHDNPDARETDDFAHALRRDGKKIGQWVRRLPRLKMDAFRIEKGDSK